MAKCSHRVYTIIGYPLDMRVKCSVCGLIGTQAYKTDSLANRNRREDFKAAEVVLTNQPLS